MFVQTCGKRWGSNLLSQIREPWVFEIAQLFISTPNHAPSHAPDTTHKAVSENSVPLNPMVNDHYPY